MIKITDKVTLGIYAGVIANVFRNFLGGLSYYLDIQAYHVWHYPASTYLPLEEIKNHGIFIGAITDYMIASMVGVLSVYLLKYIGFKNLILKGLFIGSITWIFIFSTVRMGITGITPQNVLGSFSLLFNHLFLGFLIVLIIKRHVDKVY